MSRLTRDGTAEPVSRDQIIRHERGLGDICFPCSPDHEQDWQPYPVDPYSCYMCEDYDHTLSSRREGGLRIIVSLYHCCEYKIAAVMPEISPCVLCVCAFFSMGSSLNCQYADDLDTGFMRRFPQNFLFLHGVLPSRSFLSRAPRLFLIAPTLLRSLCHFFSPLEMA